MAHWVAIGMIFIRGPASPTSVDLFVCRAYPLVFGIAMLLAPEIMGGFLGGIKHRPLLDRWFGFDLLQDGEPAGLLYGIAALIFAVVLSFFGRAKSKLNLDVLRAEVLKYISIGMPIGDSKRIMEENGFQEADPHTDPSVTVGSRLVFRTAHGKNQGEICISIYHEADKVTDIKVDARPSIS